MPHTLHDGQHCLTLFIYEFDNVILLSCKRDTICGLGMLVFLLPIFKGTFLSWPSSNFCHLNKCILFHYFKFLGWQSLVKFHIQFSITSFMNPIVFIFHIYYGPNALINWPDIVFLYFCYYLQFSSLNSV